MLIVPTKSDAICNFARFLAVRQSLDLPFGKLYFQMH